MMTGTVSPLELGWKRTGSVRWFKFCYVIRKKRPSNRTIPGPITIAIWSEERLAT
jgi:methionine synthase II (cobalamin-independent)